MTMAARAFSRRRSPRCLFAFALTQEPFSKILIPSSCIWTRNSFQDIVDLIGCLRSSPVPPEESQLQKKQLPLPGFRGSERPSLTDVKMLCHIFEHIPWSPVVEKNLRQRDFCLTAPQVIQVLNVLKGNMRNAFNFFIWAGQQRGQCYDTKSFEILKNLFEHNMDDIGPMMRDMEKDRRFIPLEAFMILMEVYAEKNMVEQAIEIFHNTRKYGCRPDEDAYNLILEIVVGVGRIELAQAIFEQMRVDRCCAPNEITLHILLYGLGKASKVTEARKVLGYLKGVNELPAVEAHRRLINGLCEGGWMGQAEEAVIEMYEVGIEPDINVYSSLISGHAKAGNMVEAYRYYMEIEKDRGLTPNMDSFSALILGYCNVNDVEAAHKLIKEMVDKGFAPNIDLYNGLISAAWRAGLVHKTRMLFDEMVDKGITANTESYNALIAAACEEVQVEMALSLFHEMIGKDIPPNAATFAALFLGLRKANIQDHSLKLLEKMEESKISKGCLYKTFISSLCKEDEEVATNILGAMVEKGHFDRALVAIKNEGCLEIDLYSVLVKLLCKAGKVYTSVKLWKEIIYNRDEAEPTAYSALYSSLVVGLCKVDDVDMACKCFDEMKCRGFTLDAAAYNALFSSFCRSQNQRSASDLYHEMRSQGHIADDPTTSAVFLNLLSGIKETKDCGFVLNAGKEIAAFKLCNSDSGSSKKEELTIHSNENDETANKQS